jgi:Flp pilus assembly pilin Flp
MSLSPLAPRRALHRTLRRLRLLVTALRGRLRRLRRDDSGMSTVEYAIGTVAAAAFAVVLWKVVTGESVTAALTQIVQRALSTTF